MTSFVEKIEKPLTRAKKTIPEIKYAAFTSPGDKDYSYVYRIKDGVIEAWNIRDNKWGAMGKYSEISEEQFVLWRIKRNE